MLQVASEYEANRFREAAFGAFANGVLKSLDRVTYPQFLKKLGLPFDEPERDVRSDIQAANKATDEAAAAFRRQSTGEPSTHTR